jgi:hypothetical protein
VFLHTFEYYDPVHKVSFNGKSKIITLELSKLEKIVEKPIESMSVQEYWGIFFRYLTDKSKRCKINEIIDKEEGIAMASEVLQEFTKDEIEYFHKISKEKYELDMQSRRVTAMREARQEGRQEGIQEGLEKGTQKGMNKIIDLLKSGKSPEDIIRDYEK